jgi:hypothetical protein
MEEENEKETYRDEMRKGQRVKYKKREKRLGDNVINGRQKRTEEMRKRKETKELERERERERERQTDNDLKMTKLMKRNI